MEQNIESLLAEAKLLSSKLEQLVYGSIEIRTRGGKNYLYVHKRVDGIKKSQYVGEFSYVLGNMIAENNLVAKQYKKLLKAIKKELDTYVLNSDEPSPAVLTSVALARRYMVDSVYKQAMLEGVATTYAQTETIFDGGVVNGMTASDIMKVVNLKRAWEFIVSDGVISFSSNFAILSNINQIVEDGFSSLAGKIRSVSVTIGGSSYIPPYPIESKIKEDLDEILCSGLSPIDVAIELILFVMKRQIFIDGNKRTAVIFANHYLISHGEGLIVVPAELVSEYKKLLIDYYEDKDLSSIKDFLKSKCWIKAK